MKTPIFKLEKHVPIPPQQERSPLRQAITKMEAGDSLYPLTKKEVATARAFACKLHMVTTTRIEGEAWRFWLVAKKPHAPESVSGSDFGITQPPPPTRHNNPLVP